MGADTARRELRHRTAGFSRGGVAAKPQDRVPDPGADCNPYLAFAASLALASRSVRTRVEPPPCFTGDVYSARDLPRCRIRERRHRILRGKRGFAKRAFGEEVVEHYAHFFRRRDRLPRGGY